VVADFVVYIFRAEVRAAWKLDKDIRK